MALGGMVMAIGVVAAVFADDERKVATPTKINAINPRTISTRDGVNLFLIDGWLPTTWVNALLQSE